jgi:hypothetical protein
VKEYDIFIPLTYNDGRAVEGRKLRVLQARLIDEFGGLTFFPQPNKGFWTLGDTTFQDEIVIYRVLSSSKRAGRRFLSKLKEELKGDLDQEEILIIERDVTAL